MCPRPPTHLGLEWMEVVWTATRNLGFTELTTLPDEHWQRVLASVEARMRLKRVDLPAGWRERLAWQVGRSSPV
ncbi:hypothetical protein [Methylobacterium oryzisoli]|uniref:hypothetical protein n=1 Tax=Methylobacterium oryzisoli TaxID=3385502 RepID=UPI003892081C